MIRLSVAMLAAFWAVFTLGEAAYSEEIRPVTPLADAKMKLTMNEDFRNWPESESWTPWVGYGASEVAEQVYVPQQVSKLPGGGIRLRAERKQTLGKPITSGAVV